MCRVLPEALASANPGEPPGTKRGRLVIAEPGEHGILSRKIVVEPDIERVLIQLSHWNVVGSPGTRHEPCTCRREGAGSGSDRCHRSWLHASDLCPAM